MQFRDKRVIAFDLGYTLVTNDRASVHQHYLLRHGVSVEQEAIARAYHVVIKEFMRRYPKAISMDWRQFLPWLLGRVNFELGHRLDLIEQTEYMFGMSAGRDHIWRPFPWTTDTLLKIGERGYRIALLSNWDLSARAVLRSLELDSYFEVTVISSEVGCEKPDARIFHELLKQLHCGPDEVLYVGDNYYDDVIAAQAAGIAAVLLNPYGSLGIEELDFSPVVPDIRSLLEMI
ncbi:MAG: HAD-IA family hydrolase [Selenomonadales bacterium]|nr:HAD-IA family hydrolase [Selenomonadales bacterium]